MTGLRMLRIALWGAIGLTGVAFALVSTGLLPKLDATLDATTASVNEIGGSFRLTSHTGKPFSDADVKGRPFALFFGFTSCPDVCPTTLYQLSALMQKLEQEADRMPVLFVTVDPERDTPEQLASYLSSFDPRIVGLTGTPSEVNTTTKTFRAYYRKVDIGDGDYTMDHTAAVYLMGADGRFVATLDPHEAESAQIGKLRRLLGTSL